VNNFESNFTDSGVIQRHLTETGAVTPAQRKCQLGLWDEKKYKETGWPRSGIANILRDPTYTGCRVYRKRKKALYQGIVNRTCPRDEWKILPDMHEAIISQELFDTVQELMDRNKKERDEALAKTQKERDSFDNIFSGMVYCADCGRPMRFIWVPKHGKKKNYPHFVCSGYINQKKRTCESRHQVRYSELHDLVAAVLSMQIKLAGFAEKKLKSKAAAAVGKEFDERIKALSEQTEQNAGKRTRLYEGYAEGLLDADEYQYAKKVYDEEAEKLRDELESVKAERDKQVRLCSSDNAWLSAAREYKERKEPDGKMVRSLVEKVLVHEDGQLEIVLRFEEERQVISQIISEDGEHHAGR